MKKGVDGHIRVVRGQTDDRYRRSMYKTYRAAKEEKSGNGNGEDEHL